jgi:hypothetical protein
MTQTTLLVSHKGVDLHAVTALRVMQRRLEGGDALQALHRCEVHTFCDGGDGRTVAELLEIGRYFNPNKHHWGHFELTDGAANWLAEPATGGADLAPAWPGRPLASDLAPVTDDLADRLLGGVVPDPMVAVDVVATPLGERGPLLSGVLWRLVLADDGRAPGRLAERLTVARTGRQGLLVNPHLHGWRTVTRRGQRAGKETP